MIINVFCCQLRKRNDENFFAQQNAISELLEFLLLFFSYFFCFGLTKVYLAILCHCQLFPAHRWRPSPISAPRIARRRTSAGCSPRPRAGRRGTGGPRWRTRCRSRSCTAGEKNRIYFAQKKYYFPICAKLTGLFLLSKLFFTFSEALEAPILWLGGEGGAVKNEGAPPKLTNSLVFLFSGPLQKKKRFQILMPKTRSVRDFLFPEKTGAWSAVPEVSSR